MKKILPLFWTLSAVLLCVACSSDDDGPSGITLFEVNGMWDCAQSESCQDVYEFQFQAGTRVSFFIEDVTGSSVVRLAVHAPNIPLGGTNVLTGNALELQCEGQDEETGDPNLVLSTTGVYQFVVTRDWGLSAGFDGTYQMTIISDTPFQELTQTVDDVDSLSLGTDCP